jgi:hypothetical protein
LVPLTVDAQELEPVWDGERLGVSSASLHFLAGDALDRLHDGATVAIELELGIEADGNRIRTSRERCVFSYDLWEERFSVTRTSDTGGEVEAISYLDRNAAEKWCLEHISLATDGIDADRRVRVTLRIRSEVPRDMAPVFGTRGISLGGLVDLLSKRRREDQPAESLVSDRFRLRDLRQRE